VRVTILGDIFHFNPHPPPPLTHPELTTTKNLGLTKLILVNEIQDVWVEIETFVRVWGQKMGSGLIRKTKKTWVKIYKTSWANLQDFL